MRFDGAAVWDVVPPQWPMPLRGVRMAGFRDLGASAAAHRVIAHPAITLAVDFGPGRLVVADAAGVSLRGSVAAGLGFGPGPLWVGGHHFEAVQIRFPPTLAQSLL
ncbi:MAG: AraC family transcriptional regulator, partial [Catenulispora sp.]|nr:AraC family transcriptional regulator [Catenulispora sp.]